MVNESRIPRSLFQILSQYFPQDAQVVEEVEKCTRLVKVPARSNILKQGEVCNSFIINRQGLFRVSHIGESGEDTVLFGTSGDVFTSIHSYYAGEPSIFSLQAIVDSEVWLLPYSEAKRLQEKHPAFMKWLNALLVEQLYSLEKRYLFYNNKSAEDRLLNFMHLNSDTLRRTPSKYISTTVPLKYIAQYLKITQSTLSRLRKRLARN